MYQTLGVETGTKSECAHYENQIQPIGSEVVSNRGSLRFLNHLGLALGISVAGGSLIKGYFDFLETTKYLYPSPDIILPAVGLNIGLLALGLVLGVYCYSNLKRG